MRLSQERKLAEFTQADVYVSAPFDLILVDTPGLGATLENEKNAVDALASTDVVLYTVDAENMGGARDTALLNRIQEINLPFRCILTKADVLEAEEVEQAVAYLSEELEIDAAHIFPVSAYHALLGRPEPGIDKLKRHLSGEVAPRGKTCGSRRSSRSCPMRQKSSQSASRQWKLALMRVWMRWKNINSSCATWRSL